MLVKFAKKEIIILWFHTKCLHLESHLVGNVNFSSANLYFILFFSNLNEEDLIKFSTWLTSWAKLNSQHTGLSLSLFFFYYDSVKKNYFHLNASFNFNQGFVFHWVYIYITSSHQLDKSIVRFINLDNIFYTTTDFSI